MRRITEKMEADLVYQAIKDNHIKMDTKRIKEHQGKHGYDGHTTRFFLTSDKSPKGVQATLTFEVENDSFCGFMNAFAEAIENVSSRNELERFYTKYKKSNIGIPNISDKEIREEIEWIYLSFKLLLEDIEDRYETLYERIYGEEEEEYVL